MSAPVGEKQTWGAFVEAIATVAAVPAERLEANTGLVRDLALDSLALAEVAVLLIVDFDMEGLSDGLEQRDWSRVTVGELYDEYLSGSPAARRPPPLIRD